MRTQTVSEQKQNSGKVGGFGHTAEVSFGGFRSRWTYDEPEDRRAKRSHIARGVASFVCCAGICAVAVSAVTMYVQGAPSAGLSVMNVSAVRSVETTAAADEFTEEFAFDSLGCACVSPNDELAQYCGLPQGVMVTYAKASSELYRCDIITEVLPSRDAESGTVVKSVSDLKSAVAGRSAGETVWLKVFRRGGEYVIAQEIYQTE